MYRLKKINFEVIYLNVYATDSMLIIWKQIFDITHLQYKKNGQ